MAGKAKYLNGHFSGELLCLRRAENTPRGTACWLCLCNCGRTCIARADYLLSVGRSKSCPYCSRLRVSRKITQHGMSRCDEYKIHTGLLQRCINEKLRQYNDYGGRGIGACMGCRNFPIFYGSVGPRPSKNHSIDRKDNEGGYWCGICEECIANGWPMNLQWATRTENNRNRRTSVMLTIHDVTLHVHEWAEITGINPSTMRRRLRCGWSHYDAVMTPVGQRRRD